MNVGELKAELAGVPDDTPLFTDGYEGGVNDLSLVDRVHVKRDVNHEHYYGSHETVDLSDSYEMAKYGPPDCEGYRLR